MAKLGYLQQRAMDFLTKHPNTGHHFCYNNSENKRIVDSLEKRGLISVFRYPPTASKDCFVTLVKQDSPLLLIVKRPTTGA
jgi:DNA-binding MarR family transcriptional regulator